MESDSRIREHLERKIKQREAQKPLSNPSMSHSFLSNISFVDPEPIFVDYSKEQSSNIELEMRQAKKGIAQLQHQLDQLRFKRIEIAKEEQSLRAVLKAARADHETDKNRLKALHTTEINSIRTHYEAKEEGFLGQIEKLISEKGQLIQEEQKHLEEFRRMEKFKKEQKERYSVAMKTAKEAFLFVEKEKQAKFEKERLAQLKEQAIKDAEPKLAAIIKQAAEDVKKSEFAQNKELTLFKQSLKAKLEKQLLQAKQTCFKTGENEKEEMRVEFERSLKQRCQERQVQLEREMDLLRQQWDQRIHVEERKVSEDISQFISRNKQSYNANMEELRELRNEYQIKIKKMKENIQSNLSKRILDFEVRAERECKKFFQQIDQQQEEKYNLAEAKLSKQIDNKLANVRSQVDKEQQKFKFEIEAKHEKWLLNQQKINNENVDKLKNNLSRLEEKMVDYDTQISRFGMKIKALQKERLGVIQINEQTEAQIRQLQSSMQAYQRKRIELQRIETQKIAEIGKVKEKQLLDLKERFLRVEEERAKNQMRLIEEYGQEKDTLEAELEDYKKQIEGNLSKKNTQLRRLLEEIQSLKAGNQQLHSELQRFGSTK